MNEKRRDEVERIIREGFGEPQPIAWISEETRVDLLNGAPWVYGAFGEFSQKKRDTHPIPLYLKP